MTKFSSFLILLLFFQCCAAQQKKPFQWKNGAKAAICLTYDDGMQTQLDHAIPQLDSLGIKGSFFINTISGRDAIVGWKNALKSGHEIGNHSLFHPCPKSLGWPAEVTTENYSIDQILQEIKTVNHIIKSLAPQYRPLSYAYPCNNTKVGGTSYVDSLKTSQLIRYARGGGSTKEVNVHPFSNLNTMEVPSWAIPEGTETKELIQYAEKALKKGGLAVFQFHGVGGQWIKVSKASHWEFLSYLNKNQEDYWVAPFSEIMAYIEENK